ncbi:MAG: hydroxymethylbilane synthase, partial [Planctomycetota bacterium]
MNQRTVRIATRESPLAMWQARYVETLLTDAGFITQLVPLTSEGDVDLRPFDAASRQQQAPTVGLFTKRIQQAVLDETADIAVHSLKDLPTATDSRLTLAFVPERGPITDALVHPDGLALDQLPQASIIGTGSRRRGAQLLHVRPDLQVRTIRGNVQTRLQKLSDGEYDAIILATAGLERLEYDQV